MNTAKAEWGIKQSLLLIFIGGYIAPLAGATLVAALLEADSLFFWLSDPENMNFFYFIRLSIAPIIFKIGLFPAFASAFLLALVRSFWGAVYFWQYILLVLFASIASMTALFMPLNMQKGLGDVALSALLISPFCILMAALFWPLRGYFGLKALSHSGGKTNHAALAGKAETWGLGKVLRLIFITSIIAPLAVGLALASLMNLYMLGLAIYGQNFNINRIFSFVGLAPMVLMLSFLPGLMNGLVVALTRYFAGPLSLRRYSLTVIIASLCAVLLMIFFITGGKYIEIIFWGGLVLWLLYVATCLAFWRLRRRLGLGVLSA